MPRPKKSPPTAVALRRLVEKTLSDHKALDVVVIDLAGKSDIADCMIIASGTSQRHISSMADILREEMKKSGMETVAVEGMGQSDWVLLDGGDVIVHLFRPEVRQFYELEKMWSTPVSAGSDATA